MIKESLTYAVEVRNIDKNTILAKCISNREYRLKTGTYKVVRRIRNEQQETRGMKRQLQSMEKVTKIHEHTLLAMQSPEDKNRRLASGESYNDIQHSIIEKERQVDGGRELTESYKIQIARMEEDNHFIAIRNIALEEFTKEQKERDLRAFASGTQGKLFV